MMKNFAAALGAGLCIVAMAAPAQAQTRDYDIPAGSLKSALDAYARQSGLQVIYRSDDVRGRRSAGVRGTHTAEAALSALLEGSGFGFRRDSSGAIAIVRKQAAGPSSPVDTNTDIVVTGTNIRGVNPVSPLSRYDRAEIDRGGFASTDEFARSIPQNVASVSAFRNLGGQTAPGQARNPGAGSGINLRGLGPSSTLVLLNGRRLAAAPPGDFVDITAIPLTAVERVDVVTDGASAIYGADAVGGVVNFILRRDFEGAEARVRRGFARGGGSDFRAGATAGLNWRTGNMLLSYEHAYQNNLLTRSRRFSATVADPTDLIPEQRSDTILLSAAQDIGPVTLSIDGLYSERDVRRLSKDTTFNAEASEYPSRQYSIAAGLKYHISSSWRADASLTYGSGKAQQILFRPTSEEPGTRFVTTMTNAELNLDGRLFDVPGGSVKLALGAAYRRETLDDPSESFSGRARNIFAQYGELFIPVVGEGNAIPGIRRFEVTGALRHERYSEFGTTTNPKLGLLWEPLPGLSLRGTYGKSFRAPLFTENSAATSQTVLAALPDPSSTTGSSLTLIKVGGSGRVQPEKATTWTFGADYSPPAVPGLTLNATYFRIDYRDRISIPTSDLINVLNDETTFASIIDRSPDVGDVTALLQNRFFLDLYFQPYTPGDIRVVVDNQTSNIALTRERGIDVSARYAIDAGSGRLEASFAGTVLLKKKDALTSAAAFVSSLNRPLQPIDFRFRAGLSWNSARWGIAAHANYVDGYRNTLVAPSEPVSSWLTFDLSGNVRTSENAPAALRGLMISLSARNIFDKAPPYVDFRVVGANYGFDPANADPIGRVVAIELRKTF